MRGDILLFESMGTWSDKLIEWGTKGRFTHVEIDLGDGESIGALSTGIVRHKYNPTRGMRSFTPPTTPDNIEYAVKWAEQQAGKQYGWADIVSNGFKIIGIPLELGEPDHWDCSDFVTRYLNIARASGPLGKQADDPGLVSPNDIARAYNIK